MMELDLVKVISDYGVNIVISGIFLMLAYKLFNNQNEMIKKQFEENLTQQKEITETIILIKDKLLNGHLNSDDLKCFARIHWIRLCDFYRAEIMEYIIRNNIKENYSNIETELDKKMLTAINRVKELLKTQTNGVNFIIIIDVIIDNYKILHTYSMEMLRGAIIEKENDCKTKNTLCNANNLARVIKNHIEHLKEEVIDKINVLNL